MTSRGQDPRAGAFRAIATLMETIEATESHVQDVTLFDKQVSSSDTLGVEFEVTVPNLTKVARMGIRPEGEGLRVDGDGTCCLTFTVEIPLDDMFRSSARSEQARAEIDAISTSLEHGEGSGPMSENESTRRDGPTGKSGGSTKAYRDPDRLQEVYEEYDTFAEMRDALGVDVTPQTVRRHMIKHDIHEVSTNPVLDYLQKSAIEQTDRPPRDKWQPSGK